MSHKTLRRGARIGFGALVLLAAAPAGLPAFAADLAYPPPYPEPGPSRIYREERIEEQVPPPPPRAGPTYYGPRFVAGPRFAPPPEDCHTVIKRRIDFDGDEVERRVRVCEDAPYPRPRYRPSFYDPGLPPVPPADVHDERFERPPPRW